MSVRRTSWILPVTLIMFSVLMGLNIYVTIKEADIWLTVANFGLAIFPCVYSLFNIAMRYDLRAYLWGQKVWALIKGGEINWSLMVRLSGSDLDRSSMTKIGEALRQFSKGNDRVRVEHLTASRAIVTIPSGPRLSMTYRLAEQSAWEIEGVEPYDYITFNIDGYRVSRKGIPSAINKDVVPVLEVIAECIRDAQMQCTMVIDFVDRDNPFYGLFIANLPPNVVSDYTIQLQPHGINRGTSVEVTKSKIHIKSNSRQELGTVALDFLTFNSTLREHLS